MRLALAQLNPRIADYEANGAAILRAAEDAAARQATLLVTPELATIGYPPRDLLERKRLVTAQWQMVHQLAKKLPLPTLIGCVEPLDDGVTPRLANAVALCQNGRVQMTYHKRLLPSYDVFDEARYFRPGGSSAVVNIGGKRIGLSVCEDIWPSALTGMMYASDPVLDLIGRCDMLVNLSASPWQQKKPALREMMLRGVANRMGVPVAYVNQVGGQDELLFDGGSTAIGPSGHLLARAHRWQEDLVVVSLETPTDATLIEHSDIHDLWCALVLGIRDYCKKTGQQRVVLGLSGGIDSAVVACLAVEALGRNNVTGLLMPGPYSSPGSVADARKLAENLGIHYRMATINATWTTSSMLLEELWLESAKLDMSTHAKARDLALENLQSRLRGLTVMAYANSFEAMALSTGNKSELAVGYCTLYGDTNGGLAPLGDLYKHQVYALARHVNLQMKPAPIPEATLTKAPSAELRPDQTDEQSLGAYDQLDPLLHAYLELGWGADDLIKAGHAPHYVAKIIRLVESSEWKRRQTPPILRVSGKAFGMGRRIPLARALE